MKAIKQPGYDPKKNDGLPAPVQNFEEVLTSLAHQWQTINIPLSLPAELWMMLEQIASRNKEDFPAIKGKDMAGIITEIIMDGRNLRAWYYRIFQEEVKRLCQTDGLEANYAPVTLHIGKS